MHSKDGFNEYKKYDHITKIDNIKEKFFKIYGVKDINRF